jgi:hypothetical protein
VVELTHYFHVPSFFDPEFSVSTEGNFHGLTQEDVLGLAC